MDVQLPVRAPYTLTLSASLGREYTTLARFHPGSQSTSAARPRDRRNRQLLCKLSVEERPLTGPAARRDNLKFGGSCRGPPEGLADSMTMLDSMRRHRHWLKWVLLLVVISFVAFYVPDFLRDRTNGAGPRRRGAPSTASPSRHGVPPRLSAADAGSSGTPTAAAFDEQMVKQLGLDQQILRQLIDERTAVAEARRLGLYGVSDAEVAQRIYDIPAFQQNGAFTARSFTRAARRRSARRSRKAEFEESLQTVAAGRQAARRAHRVGRRAAIRRSRTSSSGATRR